MISKIGISMFALGVAVAAAVASGCSSNTAQTSSTGGSTGTPGSGGTAAAPSGTGGGTTEPGTGGSGASGGSGAIPALNLCPGSDCAAASIANGAACTAACACNTCGLHRLGTRDCPCTDGLFVCTSCDYKEALAAGIEIVAAPTTPLPACAQDDETTENLTDCGTTVAVGYRCNSLTPLRVCACYFSQGKYKWDCNANPAAWPAS